MLSSPCVCVSACVGDSGGPCRWVDAARRPRIDRSQWVNKSQCTLPTAWAFLVSAGHIGLLLRFLGVGAKTFLALKLRRASSEDDRDRLWPVAALAENAQ
jgi:hypothetical protein